AAALLRRRLPVEDAALRRGLEGVRWPGRLDVVEEAPLVILDGAHNAAGMAALVAELPAIVGGRDLHVLFGLMRDKRWQGMVGALGPLLKTATLTTTLPPRGESPAALVPAFASFCPVNVIPDPIVALETLLHTVGDRDAVLVAGSLFLIGAVYPNFLARRGQRSLFGAGAATPVI